MEPAIILCPSCLNVIELSSPNSVACNQGHSFFVKDGIIDLIPILTDENLLEEEQHWDRVTRRGGNILKQSVYMSEKIVKDYRQIYKQCICSAWPDYQSRDIWIGEIGCGTGSAVSYLQDISFRSVNYIGADISMERLRAGKAREIPKNWNIRFIRTSASIPSFKQGELDIAFSASALHHLDVDDTIKWLSSSIKKGGLLMLNEPSLGNPFASIGRRMVQGFHTKGEKPLIPNKVKSISAKYNLVLIQERGLHFIIGPLHFLMGRFSPPKAIIIGSYYIARCIERIVVSPYLNYSFIHIYKKI